MLHLQLRLHVSAASSKCRQFAKGKPRPTSLAVLPNSRTPIPIFRTPRTSAAVSSVISACGDPEKKSFWGAVSLIIGTAVGPGMLGLPAATIRSGPLPSTLAILLSWVYVISSILLVAELSFAAMEEDGLQEVSFTGLATRALGSQFGAFIALVYASLSFALLVACVSGIGSIVSQWFPLLNPLMANAVFPVAIGSIIMFFPFNAIDAANRFLCFIMLLSITALVGIGFSVSRANLFASLGNASWRLSSILPAIPVTVLTLGFHVITPFICKIAGNTLSEARKAILFGGAVPLLMVLSWNFIVLGLAAPNAPSSTSDPISLLLSVNPSALYAVQGFAFSALATSLIGYAVSFPKQLLDTLQLILGRMKLHSHTSGFGRIGFAVYAGRPNLGNEGRVSFTTNLATTAASEADWGSKSSNINMFVMPIVLGGPVFIASFFRSTFSRALDFSGLYANCFLFGILPPVMAYIHHTRKKPRSSILPGGDGALLLLFGIAVSLGIWH
ncbi:uncharacterized protein LOC126795463 [Argentina anserina]|uniref:uncharacterized protein LOC126795463 n=1 Tax=Argentina anserina TaxID=57926 RepID=UPI0021762533|nr:uncharacterized protein LOC126795463 [Potentilla anserina]XP_050378261.1 uncharacterized protein LOC126795463 [Potentilla anserina]